MSKKQVALDDETIRLREEISELCKLRDTLLGTIGDLTRRLSAAENELTAAQSQLVR